jgi:predicted ArsR family transcriptional regulator
MAIVQNLNVYQFRDAFRAAGRNEQFSYEGLGALFDYLEQYSEDTGEPFELDVIAICCDFSEESYKDIADNYRIDLSDADGDEEEEYQIVLEYLQDNTTVLELGDDQTVIYQAF